MASSCSDVLRLLKEPETGPERTLGSSLGLLRPHPRGQGKRPAVIRGRSGLPSASWVSEQISCCGELWRLAGPTRLCVGIFTALLGTCP